MECSTLKRPEISEYPEYHKNYVSLVQGENVIEALRSQMNETQAIIDSISEEKSLFRYEPDKWSIRELIGHLIDTELIMAYRALRFARNDQTALSGFSQDDFVENSDYNSKSIRDLSIHFEQIRNSNISLFKCFSGSAWDRLGTASENKVSVRALAFIIAGHELHHMNILQERYLDV